MPMSYDKIVAVMAKEDCTMPMLAHYLGVERTNLYRMLKRPNPKLIIVERIAEALDVSIASFIEPLPRQTKVAEKHSVKK